ncbi:MAG: hypothetical protein M3680_24975 [Myxococcota bacterium]|nr:hypothetical protein [Myxococcota bacterium]
MSGYEKSHRPDKAVADRASESSVRKPAEPQADERGATHAQLWRELGANRAPDSPEDAASVAVEQKGGGQPADPAIAKPVGAHMGVDVSGARVHKDPLSRSATRAMGALPDTTLHQKGTRSTVYDGIGGYRFQQYDAHRGETIPSTVRAGGANPGNVVDGLINQLNTGKPPDAAELHRIRLVDESGGVTIELTKDATGTWTQ